MSIPIENQPYYLTNNDGCGFGKDMVHGTNYCVDDNEYTLTEDGEVFAMVARFQVEPVQDSKIAAEVRRQAELNQMIFSARERIAASVSENDEPMKHILQKHLDYTDGEVTPIIIEGLEAYAVGENNWYLFHLALVDHQPKVIAVRKRDGQVEASYDLPDDGYLGESKPLKVWGRPEIDRESLPIAQYRQNCGGRGFAFGPNNTSFDYKIYTVGRQQYRVLLESAQVTTPSIMLDDGEIVEARPVLDSSILLTIDAQRKEDQEISEARALLAEEFSNGDKNLEEILRMHLEYSEGAIHTNEKEGILFYQVGRNASHEFYLGVKDGKMYRYSIGEGDYDIESGIYGLDESGVREVDAHNPGYLGHY